MKAYRPRRHSHDRLTWLVTLTAAIAQLAALLRVVVEILKLTIR